jgi:peptide/nickel transport system ATP-binding protein
MTTSLLEVRGLTKHFPVRAGFVRQLFARGPRPVVRAVEAVDLALEPGEVLGVVGESGCGKSTLGYTLVRLLEPSAGDMRFSGAPVDLGSAARDKAFRRQVQLVFQDPYQSLNPRFTVYETVREPLVIHGLDDGDLRGRVLQMLEEVGLRPAESYLERYPHQLSGGQRQRVSIARAMVLEPRLLVADEPVSMLDVSIRAGILGLLRRLSEERGLAIVYISHDISTVRYLCRRTAVMYLGRIVEIGPTEQVLTEPRHPYTKALVAAVPRIGSAAARARLRLPGEVPSPVDVPSGCVFHPRCAQALASCRQTVPHAVRMGDGRTVTCVLYEEERQ